MKNISRVVRKIGYCIIKKKERKVKKFFRIKRESSCTWWYSKEVKYYERRDRKRVERYN